MFEDWYGRVTSDWFYLVFQEDAHSLAFYTFWDLYHVESQEDGVETNILTCKNSMWSETHNLAILTQTIGDRHRATATDFINYLAVRPDHRHLM